MRAKPIFSHVSIVQFEAFLLMNFILAKIQYYGKGEESALFLLQNMALIPFKRLTL